MCYDCVPVSESVCHEVIVGHLPEGIYSGGFVILSVGPSADITKALQDGGIRFEKESVAVFCRPIGEFIRAGGNLVTDFLNAEDVPGAISRDQSFPKCGAEVQTVM